MKSRALVITVVAAGVLAATGFGAYRIGKIGRAHV